MSNHEIPREKYLLIKASSPSVDVKEVRAFLAEIKTHTVQFDYLIFDFSEVTAIPHAALRTLTFAVNFVNQPNTKVAIIGNSFITMAVKESGLEKLISCHANLESVFESNPVQSADEREYLISVITDAVQMALRVVSSTDTTGVPLSDDQDPNLRNLELGAVVGLTGITFRGTLTLGMTKLMFLKLMSKMLDTEYTEIVPEIADGPAELLNMILGHLKVPMNDKGLGIVAAIPATIRGSNLQIASTAAKDSTFVLNFNSEFGNFYVELTHFQAAFVAA